MKNKEEIDTRPMIWFEAKDVEKKVTKAVYARLREFGKSFWIADFKAWVHPYNKVRNCFALTFDGFIYYKFQTMMIKGKGKYFFRFRVAELPKSDSFIMDVKLNQRLSYEKLLQKIATATVR